MAATGLGPGGSLPIGTTNPIEIPQSEAPEKVLRNDPLIPLPPLYSNGIVESFKVLSGFSDNTPGYLSEKINTNQFSIVSNKIELYSLVGLDTDSLEQGSLNLYYESAYVLEDMLFHTSDESIHFSNLESFNTDGLTEGDVNKYLTIPSFDAILATKTSDDIIEGALNQYFTSDRFNLSFSEKTTTDLSEGDNLYFTNIRAEDALVGHTSNESIHFSNLNSFDSDDLAEGAVNLYLNQANFSSFISHITTDDIAEGLSNFYYSAEKFNESFQTKSSDDLQEGSINKYVTGQLAIDISLNTGARHEHSNKSVLDTYTNSNSSITSAITNSHTHTNKAILDATEESFTSELKIKYDGFESGAITSVLSPLVLNSGVLSHSALDGNKHVPSNASASQYNVLTSGTNAGDYLWSDIETVLANSTVFEATPSSSTTKGVQSAYIDTHISNVTVDVKHLTNVELNFLQNTVPTHINSTLLHLPSITPTTDQGKFLWVDNNDEPAWTTSATNIVIAGESYISAIGDTITAAKIDLNQTNIAEGANITFSGSQISAEQRAISSTSISGNTSTSISTGWAYSHEGNYGEGAHIPTGGTVHQYIAGDGSVKSFTDAPGQTYKIILGSGANGTVAERLASADTIWPDGFSGAVGAVTTDLVITHETLRSSININIFSDDGTDITKLIGTAAYATIIGNQDKTEVRIVSLATITEKIYVYMQFE